MPEPSYGDVCTGATGHTEALEVEFDPERERYDDLLEDWFDRLAEQRTDPGRPILPA